MTTFLCWLHCRVVSGRPSRSFLGPKLAQKSDFFTLHQYNPPFRSQSDLTQCDHNNCIISYSIALCGFGVRAVSCKTPIYFMDIYLQQKLAERDDKYEYTYLEARVNWTILPTHSFLQLIAVITRIPDHHHIESHTRVAYKLLEEHCSKVWWWLQRVKRCRRLRCWRLEWWRRCTSARSRLHFLHSIPPPTSLR